MGARSFSLTLAFMAAAVSCVAAGETPSASPKSTPDANYIIGPGDVIQVFVWRNPELSVTVPVRPDGKVSTPLVEDLVAVGKTPEQLARDMEKVLAEYVRSPKVNIILTQPMSSSSQVKVIGEVKQPQSFAFRQGMTVLDALVQAGGLGQFAAGNRAKIIRTEKTGSREIRVRLADLVNGDMKQNVALLPGDVLLVPQSRF